MLLAFELAHINIFLSPLSLVAAETTFLIPPSVYGSQDDEKVPGGHWDGHWPR